MTLLTWNFGRSTPFSIAEVWRNYQFSLLSNAHAGNEVGRVGRREGERDRETGGGGERDKDKASFMVPTGTHLRRP